MNENPIVIRINYCSFNLVQKKQNYYPRKLQISFHFLIFCENCFEFRLNSVELSSSINYDNRKIRRCQWSETVVIFPSSKKSFVYVVIILIVCEWREKETQ